MSNNYYRRSAQPNAEVVTEPIAEVTETGIADRRRRRARARHDHPRRPASGSSTTPASATIRGRGGRSLLEAWEGSPRAYLGTAVSGFPNLFFLVGPNSAGGYNSIIFTSESHINYVAECRARDGARERRHGRGPPRGLRGVQPRNRAPPRRQRLEPRAAAPAGTSTRTAATASGGRASWPTSGGAPAASTAAATAHPLEPSVALEVLRSPQSRRPGPHGRGRAYPGRVHRDRDRRRRPAPGLPVAARPRSPP